MTAIAWNRPGTAAEGVLPFNARHHLRQVAQLISSVFADELDANGRGGALQEMQLVSRLSPVLGGLLSTAFFSEFVLGYVWVENDQVIGNVTFQRADAAGTRWRVSNVAVTPEHRRRGIARSLMLASLREIALRGGHWVILQVRADNSSARYLYETLKFTDVCQDGVWERQPSLLGTAELPPPAPDIPLHPLGVTKWQARLELARAARSPLADWAEPIQTAEYQPALTRLFGEALGNLTGLQRLSRWGAWQEDQLMGAAEVVAGGAAGQHRLSFDVRPEMRGHLESALLARSLRDLAGTPNRSIVVEHSGDDAYGVAALQAYGFRPQRILLTMRHLITPEDAGL